MKELTGRVEGPRKERNEALREQGFEGLQRFGAWDLRLWQDSPFRVWRSS